jgi:hypothetical protein
MDDDIPIYPDDEREVPLEDEAEFDAPPPTIDPDERVELDDDEDEAVEEYEEFSGGAED